MTKRIDLIYQFKITLKGISPPIWRRIHVPASYNFWELHVALNDAMGWLDYHLHSFYIGDKEQIEIGISQNDWMDAPTILLDWEVLIQQYFTEIGQKAAYHYDFGDDWHHEILFEGILLKEKKVKYPLCLAGERACPPEDCGGIYGYLDFLEILNDPKHQDYEDIIEWLNRTANYPYDPEAFDPKKVHFNNPKKRLKMVMG